MNKLISMIIIGVLSLGFAQGCVSSTGTTTNPPFNLQTTSSVVQMAGNTATSVYLISIKDPKVKATTGQEIYNIATASNVAVQSGGTDLAGLTALVNNIIAKQPDATVRLGAALLVNSLSLYVQQQMSLNASQITSNQTVQTERTLIVAALNGIIQASSTYAIPSTTQPTLSQLAN